MSTSERAAGATVTGATPAITKQTWRDALATRVPAAAITQARR